VVVETCGLGYTPGRTTREKLLRAARRNGFSPETLGAPIEVLDGELGLDSGEGGVAKGLEALDSMLVLSHATGHIQAGFGGALKNLGLGCVAKQAKYRVHFEGLPAITDSCTRCNRCVEVCPVGAIEEYSITEACVGCIACSDVCEAGAVRLRERGFEDLVREMVGNAARVVEAMGAALGYVNLLVDVTPHCDCHPHSHVPLVEDLGVLASLDPVAADAASIDLIDGEEGRLSRAAPDPRLQLELAEELGLGSRSYELRRVR
jgi:uncharacterized Fe-S center protein